jgi:hypothetical protein
MSDYIHSDDVVAVVQEAVAQRDALLKSLEASLADLSFTLNELEKRIALGF